MYTTLLCVLKWGFMWTFIEIYTLVHFYNILLVFEAPYRPRVNGMSGKSQNYQKLLKDASNLAFFMVHT